MDLLPSRFVDAVALPTTDGKAVYRATDRQTGLLCRIELGGADALALRQAHATLLHLANAGLVPALALEQLADGTWCRAQGWAQPAELTSSQLLRLWLPGWLGGLAHLHAAGRVHGGLHPGELCLTADGTALLGSPGTGRHIGQPAEPLSMDHPAWSYQAPEGRMDAGTDLFMLGAVMLFWLSGSPAPRTSEDLGAALDGLDPADAGWADLLGGLLAPSPTERFTSAGEVLSACQELAGNALPAPAGRVAPFVGRRQELAKLLAGLDEAVDTLEAKVLHLHGEAGVGKSRLLEELRQRARARGCDVLVARATRGDGAPFAAFMPLLEALLARVPLGTRKAVAPVLAALMPELGAEAPALEPRATRSRLFGAIADLIEAAAVPPGLLICLDDWHAADPASRDLLDFLGRALPPLPLCVVLASRQGPPGGGNSLTLAGLGRREAGALWRGLWDGKEPGGNFLTALEERTGGNPGLVEQTALHCKPLIAGGRGSNAAVMQATLPATLQAFWRTRLLALPQPAQSLAIAAAVAGARAGLALLQGVVELEEAPFFEALELLGETGVLAQDGEGYSLAAPEDHVLALAADAEELEAMHARALGHFRLAAQFGQAVPAARLAYHALEGARPTDAAFYALDAGRQALRLFALAEAETFLGRGVAVLPADAPAAWHTDYAVAQGDLARFQARADVAEACYRQALIDIPPARRAEVLTSLGITLGLVSRTDEAEALYREAIAGAPGDAARARALGALARLHVRLGQAA
ncbi:MAG: serine/threonine protein kinase, partial [Cyanobacteria bacterium RYN_339]|nr:serine/threonine protein kinase [Cyanobacteria bacterium RYN_339]